MNEKFHYMLGIKYDVADDKLQAFYGFKSWYVGICLYWFSLTFFKRWDPTTRYRDGRLCGWTGFVFYYKPNPTLKEGDLIWLKCKRWMWPDYPKIRKD